MSRRNVAVVAAAILAIGVLAVVGLSSGDRGSRPAPELPGQVLAGPHVDLASFRGHAVLVNFWASWCEPCKQEAPVLEHLARTAQGRDSLVGVDWNDAASNARDFISHYGWTYPVLRDQGGAVGNEYGLHGLPTTFVLNSHGEIVKTLFGPQTQAAFAQALAAAE